MGFIAAASIGGALISAYGQKKAGDASAKGAKDANKMTEQEAEREFNRQRYLAETQRKWRLQDRQYKEGAIGGFRSYATNHALKAGLAAPAGTSDAGLAEFDPNKTTVLQTQAAEKAAMDAAKKKGFAGTGVSQPPRTMTAMTPGGGSMGGQMDR